MKAEFILVTRRVSQFGIVPYVLSDAHAVHSPVTSAPVSAKHPLTNVPKLPDGIGEGGLGGGEGGGGLGGFGGGEGGGEGGGGDGVRKHELAGPVTALVQVNFA